MENKKTRVNKSGIVEKKKVEYKQEIIAISGSDRKKRRKKCFEYLQNLL